MDKLKIIRKDNLSQLPKMTGVYLLALRSLGEGRFMNNVIYIGKTVNIRERVKNHFQQPSYRDNLFIEKVEKIGFIETRSEIEALILEANLIKKHQPRFNVVWRDDKNYFYVAIAQNQNKIPFVYITHQPAKVLSSKYKVLGIKRKRILNTKYFIPNTQFIGPFVEGNALKKTLKFLRRVFPYYISPTHPKQKCTWCYLDLCPGPAPDLVDYKKNIKKLILILKGKRKTVLYALRKEMKGLSKQHEFEKAGKIRDKLRALEQIMAHVSVINQPLGRPTSQSFGMSDVPMASWATTLQALKKILNVEGNISKIECYDISNIQGKQAVGSMVVFINGAPDKNQYKKFRIKMKQEPNDIAMLKEMLQRRLTHPEWKYPEVMLIDGGIAQLNVAIKTKGEVPLFTTAVKNRRQAKKIKVISIAKGRQELFIEGRKKPIPLKQLPQEVYNLIKHLDDEAHRFAITYHKKLRKKVLGLT